MRSATLGTVAVLLMTSCYADWREDYDFAWQGERVTVYGYGHTKADLCGGSLAELDGHTAAIERALGVEGRRLTRTGGSPRTTGMRWARRTHAMGTGPARARASPSPGGCRTCTRSCTR